MPRKSNDLPPGVIDFKDLSPEVQARVKAQTGGKKPRKTRVQNMTKEDCKREAIRVLAVVADLSDSERERVLRMAIKLNEV
jgi:hypothetical protein